MAVINLTPGQSANIALSGRFLVARRVSGTVFCDDPATQLPEFSLRQGDNIDFSGMSVRSVRVTNKGTIAAQIDVESSPVRIISSDGGAVTVTGGELQRIVEPINVTATATVEDGNMTSLSQSAVDDALDVDIPAGQKVQVIGASVDKRRTVILQNISATETECRVGGPNVAAGRGALFTGSKAAPASLEFDTVGAVHVFNNSAQAAKISVMWGKR
ncbi:hypothetical protein [Rheinheimera sp.]|uniref:hypothetical protein n=1 Tax=Rheinheimera sp. TaxID=1869214 RepID=UPI003D28C780